MAVILLSFFKATGKDRLEDDLGAPTKGVLPRNREKVVSEKFSGRRSFRPFLGFVLFAAGLAVGHWLFLINIFFFLPIGALVDLTATPFILTLLLCTICSTHSFLWLVLLNLPYYIDMARTFLGFIWGDATRLHTE